MTNNITKVTEQCSPLQCFEDVGQGQSVANTQGADAYTECQCDGLFTMGSATLLAMAGLFGPEDPDKMVEKFEIAQDATAKTQLETIKKLKDNLDRYPPDKKRDAYQLLADSVQNDVIAGLKASLGTAPRSLVLYHDLAVAHERQAELLMKAGDNNAASEAFLQARGYVVSYAQTEAENDTASYNRQEGTDYEMEESLVGSYLDDEKYIVLTDQAAEAKGKAAFVEGGTYDKWEEVVEIYRDAWLNLNDLGYQERSEEMHDRLQEANVKSAVCYWLEKEGEYYNDLSPAAKEARFEWTLDVVEKTMGDEGFRKKHPADSNDGGIPHEGVTEAVNEFIRAEQLSLLNAMIDLPGHYDIVPPRGTAIKRAELCGRVAVLNAMAGRYEPMFRYMEIEMTDLISVGELDVALRVGDTIIRFAQSAGLIEAEAEAWGHKALIYSRMDVDRAVAAHDRAIELYRQTGNEGAALKETAARGLTMGLSGDPALANRGDEVFIEATKSMLGAPNGTTATIGTKDGGRRTTRAIGREDRPHAVGTKKPGGHNGKGRKGIERPVK